MVVVFLVVSAIHNLLVFIYLFFAYGEFFSVGVFNFERFKNTQMSTEI